MLIPQSIITNLQIMSTLAIIVIPVLTDHPINPYQRRSKIAIDRLKKKDDYIIDLINLNKLQDNPKTLDQIFLDILLTEEEKRSGEIDLDKSESKDSLGIEAGFIQRGDPGFEILLDAISKNRNIKKADVVTIGLLYGPVSMFNELPWNEDISQGSEVPIGPNAALFVDYESGPLPERELVIYHPESPSMTLSLHQLESWVKDAIRKKSHYLTMVLAILWATTSIISLI